MSYFSQITLGGYANAVSDAFGRARVSDPVTLFDSKMLHDDQQYLWDDQEVSGSGTSSTFDSDLASVTMGCSNVTAGKRVRQTFRRFNYQSGKSQLFMLTGNIGGGASGYTIEVGVFDDNNGVFFRNEDGVMKVVLRSNTSGSPVDTEVTQSSWTIDGGLITGSTALDIDIDTNYGLGSAIDGTSDELVLAVQPLTSNAKVRGSITWREL